MAPIIRRKQLTAPQPANQEAERSSILQDAAGAAMTGLHTVGSALSFPSRVVWGTANAISGGPGGFGNLNPFDSTGGIEASQFLANQGLISQNDPTKWEWGDLGRFGLDVLGDPTSYLGFGALTKTGQAASKAGRLTGTAAQQIGRGERALLGLQVPFSAKSVGMIGTGQRAARLAEGAANIGRRVADARIPGTQVSPVRWLTSKFDWRKLGMRTPETQAQAPRFAQQRLDSWRGNAEFLQGVARNWQQAGMDTPQWQQSLGMARELGLAIEVPVEKAGGIKLYHASPADIRGPLKPSPGRAANEPVGIFFATSEPEAMRSTGKQSSRIYERTATPKKTIDMASGEYHRMAMDANREAVAAAKNRPEFSGMADDEILSILADTEGSPQSILTSKITQKGYDSAISRGAGADGEDWFVALKPDIVSGEQMRRLTPADGPDFWNHLDPTGGLAQIDDYLKQTSARRQMKGISRTRDLVDIVQHDADEDGVIEALNNALLATNSRMKPEDAEKLAGKLAEDWSESNITQGYLPRYMRPDVRKELDRGSFKGQGAMSVESPISMQRQELLKGVRGGRTMIDSIVQDADADNMIRDLAARAESPEQVELQQQIAEMMDEYNALEADGADPDDLEALGADIADLQSQVLDRENVLGQVEGLLQSKYGDYVVPTFNDPVERGAERSRLRVMSEWMVNHPELRQNGVYGSDIVGDLWRYADNASTSENAFDFMADTVSRYSQPGRAVDRPTVDDDKFVKVGSLLAKLGAHTNEAARYIGGLLGETSGAVLERTVPKHIADDLTNLGEAIRPVKDAELGRNAFQKFMSAWKAGALSWPRRVIRDRMSGIVRNIEQGMFSGKAFLDAEHLYRGRTLRGYERIPAVQSWIQEYGLEPTEDGATEAIRRKFGSYMASNPGIFTDLSDATGSGMAGGVDQLLSAMPGAIPESFGQAAQRGVRETFSNFSKWGDIPGVKDVPEATAGPVRAAQQLSEYTDYLNRSEAFLEQLRQGESDLPTIFNRIDSAQVNYCVDEETEVLTSTGWKKWDEVQCGDLALVLDTDNQQIRWSPIQEVNIFPKMWRALHSWEGRGFSALTTPNHRWMTQRKGSKNTSKKTHVRQLSAAGHYSKTFTGENRGWKWRESQEITEHPHNNLILSGGWSHTRDPSSRKWSDEVVELCGWYVTEGSEHNACGISIGQSLTTNPENSERIRALVRHFAAKGDTATEWAPRTNQWGTIGSFYFGRGVGEDVRERLCPNKCPTLAFLRCLTARQLKLLYRTILSGDREREHVSIKTGRHSARIAQKRRDVIDLLQILAAMLGLRSSVSQKDGGKQHRLSVYGSAFARGANMKTSVVEHYGRVWCPTTATGTWMARRRGCTYWTGNSPRQSAPADRTMKNLFPFWRFMSRQMPFTLAELAMNPGGRLAQGIKAVDRGMEADPSLPDAALSGTAIPLGSSPDGTKGFLTGFGLMHETPVELLGQAGAGDLRSLGYGLAGQMNPLIQKPVEYVTGQSMFREGEKLSDLDPTVGRLLSNVGESLGLMPAGSQPVNVPYGSTIDMGISLLPGLGPLATQIRTATDPRRGALERGVQLATGARTLRQSPKAQRRVLRRRLEQLAEDEGGSLGSHLYARPGAVERNPRLGEIIALSRALERESAADRQPKRRRVLAPSSAR